MAKPDGRIEKGQPLNRAISARAWNRTQDAADLVLGASPGFEAGTASLKSLPGIHSPLGQVGFYGQVRVISTINPPAQILPQPTMPASVNSMASFSDREKILPQFTNVFAGGVVTDDECRFAICCTNNDDRWTISGYAITRVRVYNYAHRFAFYQQITTPDEVNGGFLDTLSSTFWGPARIIGYFNATIHTDGTAGAFANRSGYLTFEKTPALVYPNTETRWALVAF